MWISPDPCKGGLESLGHFHSLPEFNTEVHDGVAIGVNFWVCLWDSWCMILWSFSYDKAFEQLFSIFFVPLSLSVFVSTLNVWGSILFKPLPLTIARYFEAEFQNSICIYIYILIYVHIIHIQVDIVHIHICIHKTNLLVHIIPDQFCLVVFFKVHFSMLVTHLFVVLMILER